VRRLEIVGIKLIPACWQEYPHLQRNNISDILIKGEYKI